MRKEEENENSWVNSCKAWYRQGPFPEHKDLGGIPLVNYTVRTLNRLDCWMI